MKSGDPKIVIGVDLGGTSIKAGVVAAGGSILYHNKFPTFAKEGPSKVIKQIGASIQDALKNTNGARAEGIGIGAPGVVDDEGVVKAPPNFEDWDEVPLKAELSKAFPNLPIGVENDANAAAIAESRFGAGIDIPNFLFVIWGTGVGGGILLNDGGRRRDRPRHHRLCGPPVQLRQYRVRRSIRRAALPLQPDRGTAEDPPAVEDP
jgi:predicted NBD/HSP70 family sugar kinase